MCGIFCCISKTCKIHKCLENSMLKGILQNRGPDSNGIREIDNIVFGGFVLWQQGIEICSQPVESDTYLLVINGDIYNISNSNSNTISDTIWLLEQLSNTRSELEIINLFKTIEGPFSIIFYNKTSKELYFGRDSLGRNSMLIESSNEHLRLLSSSYISDRANNTIELPPLGIYKISNGDFKKLSVFPWRAPDDEFFNHKEHLEKCQFLINIQYSIEPDWLLEPAISEKYNFNFYKIVDTRLTPEDLYDFLLKNDEISMAIKEFSTLLENSVKKRVQLTTSLCSSCLFKDGISCSHSKVAILFSGGIDCAILAVLSDRFVRKGDSIDLINVAFQRTISDEWNVPDRVSAKFCYQNLKHICPDRKWNFIEVNVSKQELHEHLNNYIKHLIYPLNTVLDESIGCAFWFASRAVALNTKSSARVVIVGSGADELFGGYVRHKNAYNRFNGTETEKQLNLLLELERDWSRIPSRNLARDDRVISDNGKTPRAPFIEEHLVNFVRALKPYQRCCFLLEDGIGDKLFLRLLGYKLGLTNSAFLKKRAIQFGSRIANKKQNAKDRSAYL